ncbi:hypothetical protein M23134_08443 [Microscilla marina ATCC 23134]|uniref:Uncharacterized protein n=1 Tax=Microscilla marina ATCC 23134 TaxID=313606 RepID=A1ZR80_MICM2|nr:hypothetical protein M23134_08443 [Microscilla marina ATCC 23134]
MRVIFRKKELPGGFLMGLLYLNFDYNYQKLTYNDSEPNE